MLKRNYWANDFISRLLTNFSSVNGLSPALTLANVVVSKPAKVSGTWHSATTTKNTAVRITGIAGVNYTDSNYILYNRESFATYIALRGTQAALPMLIPGSLTKKSQLVPFLNIYYGLGLSPEEIVEGNVVIPTDGNNFTIRIDPTPENYQYNVGYDFVCKATGNVASTTVKTTDLSGLNYPSADLTVSQAYVFTYPLSFTSEFATLSKLTVQSQVDDALAKSLSNVTGLTWTLAAGNYSLSGAKISYAALNSSAVFANPDFKYVVTIDLGTDSAKMRGTLILQFNEPFDVTLPPDDGEKIPE